MQIKSMEDKAGGNKISCVSHRCVKCSRLAFREENWKDQTTVQGGTEGKEEICLPQRPCLRKEDMEGTCL